MRAVILAGGKGTRLAPFTVSFPKPMVPLGDMPILEIVVRQLANAGFTRATLTLGYLGELIQAFFMARSDLRERLAIDYVTEESPTGTAGSLALIDDLPETFLVMNGDVLTTLDYADLVRQHEASGAALTIATHKKRVKIDLGVLDCDDRTGRIVDYVEKPEYDYLVSMGVYVYSRRVLDFVEKGAYLDFPSLVLRLIEAGEVVRRYENDASWLDIGRHGDYAEAQEIFESRRADFRCE